MGLSSFFRILPGASVSIVLALSACLPTSSSSSECTPGLEGCECLPSGGCDRGLSCESSRCVSLSDGNLLPGTSANGDSPDAGVQAANDAATGSGREVDPVGGASNAEGTGSDAGSVPTDAGSTDAGSTDDAGVESPGSGCGNGVWEQGEACDDGNLDNGDGCSQDCSTRERGYACFTPGGACSRVSACGDGLVDPAERCDDDNGADGDGCSAQCRLEPGFACGIATVEIEGIDAVELASHLWQEHRIIVVGIKHPELQGIRVSPSVYTTLEEVDRFADAMESILEKGSLTA